MGGTYWTGSVPDLSDFYCTVVGSVVDDPRKEIHDVMTSYEKMHGKPLTLNSAFSIYVWLGLWARAVEKAGSFDADKVVAVMNGYTNVPTFLGPYSFTPKLHIQTETKLLITAITNGKTSVVGELTRTEPIPDDVLYRQN